MARTWPSRGSADALARTGSKADSYIGPRPARLAVIGAAVLVVSLLGESDSVRADAHGRPNIVVIVTDDQSMDSVAKMPHVSGRTDWINFENAFLNVALCCPSRATILTGRYSHHTGVEDNQGAVFDESATLGTWLQEAGYRTSFIGKYLNGYPFGRGHYVPPGWHNWRVFESVGYYNYSLNENRVLVNYGSAPTDYSTDVLVNKARTFISKQTGPFFLMLAPNAPHGPRTPAPRHLDAFTDEAMPIPENFNEADVSDKPAWVQGLPSLTDEQAATLHETRRNQYRTMLSVDGMVKKVFDAVEAQGSLDNTVVIFMTDNGYSFGEHRWERKTCPYEECIRTPLLIRYPGQPGRRVTALAQNVDLASTIAELAGATPTLPQDGRSLVPLLEGGSPPWREEVLLRWARTSTAVTPYWGIRTARYTYVEYESGEKELYDLDPAVDPYQMTNQADQPLFSVVQADLARRLEAIKPGARLGPALAV